MNRIAIVVIFLMLLTSCDTFVGKKKAEELKQFESTVYVTLNEINAGERSLPKNTKIYIRIRTDKDWVKVYGFPVGSDELHSKQVLILYLFKEDFQNEKFNDDLFWSKLNGLIKKVELTER